MWNANNVNADVSIVNSTGRLLPFYIGSKDYNDSLMAGWMGHCLILSMSFFNVMYYADLQYRHINQSRYHSWGLGFRTVYGSVQTIRVLSGISLWLVVGIFATLALAEIPIIYQMLYYVVLVVGWTEGIRIFVSLIVMIVSFFVDDNKKNYDLHNYFRDQIADGGWANGEIYYRTLDLQLQMFNIFGGLMAAQMYDLGLKIWQPLAVNSLYFVPKTYAEMSTYNIQKRRTKLIRERRVRRDMIRRLENQQDAF